MALPYWPALLVGLLGLAVTLCADARYLRRAIARGHFSFLIERAILCRRARPDGCDLAVELIGSSPL